MYAVTIGGVFALKWYDFTMSNVIILSIEFIVTIAVITYVLVKKERIECDEINELINERIKKEIEYSAMSEARKEVISLLGGALAGVKNSQPVVIANPQEDMEEQPEEDVMNDSDVAGLAMGWMLKGD